MSIEKSLYSAPEGLDSLTDEPAVEIEIEDPESVTINFDGLEIEIGKGADEDFDANLAEYLDESVLQSMVSDLIGDFDDDGAGIQSGTLAAISTAVQRDLMESTVARHHHG